MVTAVLLSGGSAMLNALTGMDGYAASFLIPIGVMVYTLAGGLQATFLASYMHSVIVHAVLMKFVILVYSSNSLSTIYDKLQARATRNSTICSDWDARVHACVSVSGNHGSSYLTMLTSGGVIFGISNIVGNFAPVFVDNGYWISAIAARPSSARKGYLLGGLVWFAIPFSLGTALGLGAVTLDLSSVLDEADQGLAPIATAITLMGQGGALLLLTMLFMAMTSAVSAELIAVSSLCTYDIYRTYLNPQASGQQILRLSRLFGCLMGFVVVILGNAGFSVEWIYSAIGVIIGSAVMPVAFLLLWSKANARGAIAGALIGCIAGIITWLTVTKVEFGRVDLVTTGHNAPMLAGNLISILVDGAIHAIFSFMSPQNFDWASTKNLTVVEEERRTVPEEEHSEGKLRNAKNWILRWSVGLTILIVVLWPLFSLPAKVFSEGYFKFWVVISIVWASVGSIIIFFLPLYESWRTLCRVISNIFPNLDTDGVDLVAWRFNGRNELELYIDA
ncbi:hypothetical protein KP509_09G092400 [Ceratopteris richardii]|uniref:Uncharacterized protein n=1 Tax=Ceratopteris richardii TaxID=49495 RepID=A0A8T2U4R2_CERRI|nr:hypothetical protein KP509_09G092400 [Ceratopteris richardii]